MCQYTPDNKRTKNTNQTKMCAIMVFYVYFVLYIELLFGNVDLNGSLKIHKAIWKDIKVQGDAVNTYREVFSYTPESDCLISLYANAYYSSGKPIGLKASVAGNIVDPGDTNEMIVSKVESDNYKEIIISCNVYVLAGHKIKIEEKISSSGYFTGGIVYAINRL